MKHLILILSFSFILSSPFYLYSAESNQEIKKESAFSGKTIYEQLSRNDFIDLNKAQIEAKIGRKLKLKEKLIFKAVKRKLIKHPDLNPEKALDEVKFDGLAIAGFVTSIVGLLLFGIILGLASVVFGAIALRRIRRDAGTRKGKGLAIAAIIIGFIDIAGTLIFLSLL